MATLTSFPSDDYAARLRAELTELLTAVRDVRVLEAYRTLLLTMPTGPDPESDAPLSASHRARLDFSRQQLANGERIAADGALKSLFDA